MAIFFMPTEAEKNFINSAYRKMSSSWLLKIPVFIDKLVFMATTFIPEIFLQKIISFFLCS
jgi:hypothetical protein